MATGIEIAGLTLAAFPIVIDGLSRFVEGVRIIKTWGTFRRELAIYQYGLRSARAFFQNTIEELLEGIATQEDIMTFRRNPDGLATPNPQYEEQLKARLDHDYDNCLEAMARILSAMETFRSKLDMDAAGKVRTLTVRQAYSSSLYSDTRVLILDHVGRLPDYQTRSQTHKACAIKEDLSRASRRD